MDYNVFFQKLDGLLSDKRMDEAEQLLIDNVKSDGTGGHAGSSHGYE